MNICQVIFSYGWGGAEARIHELIKCLRDKGENISLVINQEMVKYYADLENIPILNIGSLYPPRSAISHLPLERVRNYRLYQAFWLIYLYLDEPLRYRYYRRVREQVRRFLHRNQVQIIHSHSPGASMLVSALGDLEIPTVAANNGEHALRGEGYVHPLARPIMNWQSAKFAEALSRADRVTTGSDFMVRTMADWGIPLKSTPVIFPAGVNVAEIQGDGSSTLQLEGTFTMLFPGGPKWTKGGDILMEALAKVRDKIPDIHLYIALDVPPGHKLRRMASKLNLERNVTFVGFLPVPEYRNLLGSVDLFVMPSRIEAFAFAVLEAMALGKPMVAANTGGFPEQIEHGRNGMLIGLEPAEIAQAILYLYQNEPLRREIGQNNLKDVAKFDLSSTGDRCISFYRETLYQRS